MGKFIEGLAYCDISERSTSVKTMKIILCAILVSVMLCYGASTNLAPVMAKNGAFVEYMQEHPEDYLCDLEPERIGHPQDICVHAFVSTMKAFENGKTRSTLGWSNENRIDAVLRGLGKGFLSQPEHLTPLLAEMKKYEQAYFAKGDYAKASWCDTFALFWASKIPSCAEVAKGYSARLAELDNRICHGIRKVMETDKRISVRSQDFSVLCTRGSVKLAGLVDDQNTIMAINDVATRFSGVTALQNGLRYRDENGNEQSSNIINCMAPARNDQPPLFPEFAR